MEWLRKESGTAWQHFKYVPHLKTLGSKLRLFQIGSGFYHQRSELIDFQEAADLLVTLLQAASLLTMKIFMWITRPPIVIRRTMLDMKSIFTHYFKNKFSLQIL